ncbi:hypothetical protein GIY23_08265 [Allosaccharopolyspora coralli]|uniref:Uncharacterized protein n=1 Tax=Allosaccharopolyspora coralli TaxID=2665642 RepID=A0A5Q3Q4I2_9PSEU|nr:hypothetical protein [Allosaccharopolyspora coralli]QGK69518.1 hypothetical protein GIY23_08265 [Allosaccharopolyspora coralli]
MTRPPQHARYAVPMSRPARLADLVLRGLCGAGLLAATVGVAFAPMLLVPDDVVSDDLSSGMSCAAGAAGLALLLTVLQRFPNVPGTALVGVVAGKLIALMILLAPVGILGALGGEEGAMWGMLLGFLALGGLLVYHLRSPRAGNRHAAGHSGGVAAGSGVVGIAAGADAACDVGDFGAGDGGGC